MAHRTALIAAGSIAVVIFAAAVAVAVNLGILNAADSSPVGKLSAAQAATLPAPEPTAKATPRPTTELSQEYVIRKAGSVTVLATKKAVRLDKVEARHGWKWSLAQSADRRLTVTFKHGSETYTFQATLGRHGSVQARVDHPVTKIVPSSSATYSVAPAAAPAGGEPGEGGEGGGEGARGGDGGYGGGADD